jgi:hypothetical protein
MAESNERGEYELVRRERVCKFCNGTFKGIHGLRIHLTYEKRKARSLVEVRQIDEEIARVKRIHRGILARYVQGLI